MKRKRSSAKFGDQALQPKFLADYFTGVASKGLSGAEVDKYRSNQHEFNGVKILKDLLGTADHKFATKFMYFDDGSSIPLIIDSSVTWYDARKQQQERSAEYRLYYTVDSSPVMDCAAEGDLLVVARQPDDSLLIIIADCGSTAADQICNLFGIKDQAQDFIVLPKGTLERQSLGYMHELILEQLGVQVVGRNDELGERAYRKFGGKFPPTRQFSEYARRFVSDVSVQDNPDTALLDWVRQEERLFRALEWKIVSEQLKSGFGDRGDSVDQFVKLSLSVINRRKSRAGLALEHHLEEVFKKFGMRFARGKKTENNSKPDFIFPSIEDYNSQTMDPERVFMLGVKSSCKDRWRQILAEAKKIQKKHLFTLEPGISSNQIEEMSINSVQLVVPQELHSFYPPAHRRSLLSLEGFISLVMRR